MQASLYLTAKKIAYQVNIKHVKLLYQLKFAFSACYDNKKKTTEHKIGCIASTKQFLSTSYSPEHNDSVTKGLFRTLKSILY